MDVCSFTRNVYETETITSGLCYVEDLVFLKNNIVWFWNYFGHPTDSSVELYDLLSYSKLHRYDHIPASKVLLIEQVYFIGCLYYLSAYFHFCFLLHFYIHTCGGIRDYTFYNTFFIYCIRGKRGITLLLPRLYLRYKKGPNLNLPPLPPHVQAQGIRKL